MLLVAATFLDLFCRLCAGCVSWLCCIHASDDACTAATASQLQALLLCAKLQLLLSAWLYRCQYCCSDGSGVLCICRADAAAVGEVNCMDLTSTDLQLALLR